jgi:competence protein ComEC
MTNGRHGSSDFSTALWESLPQQGAQEIAAVPGMTIQIGDGATLTVLQSDLNGDADPTTPGDPVVLILTYGDLRVLLCADLSPEAEQALLSSRENLDATVVVVPRGGHRANTSDDFLSTVTPQISVIIPTSNDLPHAETLARLDAVGSAIYRVDQMGTIRLTSDGTRIWITIAHR